ncbi:3-hydroxyacyl-CoA dehydrogenase NAD-binding domain-containing protein [Mycobacterium sp. 1274756.6]|uniref:3-hydroxyacyl-CoA dehydrogenase NAD-binding domain-containing protein n=1 Tax=Mycobacterium sp. 1274756.6 TaxID=1834076 RepID=UPI0007FB9DC2|nr:3-hydroxyacyl-CoA dehydrogenase NAD-binding domain-containing protein [Mycobacterium sp. 1274756.6]OBJ68021.1 3-hydroxyacyl-CoA dehydrogenase [Mycobacterium sp. 1274756.6]
MSSITRDKDADGVVTITLDAEGASANTMTPQFAADFTAAVQRLVEEKDSLAGVIVTSAKETFFAGADLARFLTFTEADVPELTAELTGLKANMRSLETLGVPVVAAINGAALGGGYEIALACHHRIALDVRGNLIGLPEAALGLLPAAGGVTRTVRMFGVVKALTEVLLQGQKRAPAAALKVGLVDELAATPEEMLGKARAWIKANPQAAQPWDVKGYRIPGGTPANPAFAANLPALPANLRKQLKGQPMRAPRAILAAAVEGTQVDIDGAFAIETRYLMELCTGPVAKNMIKAFFFDLQSIAKGGSRPDGFPVRKAEHVAVLGAGMMGAAIAYVAAQSGATVVLRDLTVEAAERGKDYSRKLLDTAVTKGRLSEAQRDELLGRIIATADIADVKGADFLVEAVFEDLDLKCKVFAEVEPYLDADAVIATNTSALPLSEMVSSISKPENFVGLHFFSPVDKMPLVEVIDSDGTSAETLARALDFAGQIKKTPIVVKDVYAFYANRVIFKFVEQALSLVAEGVHPASVEQATTQAGFPVGALALLDEVNMKTTQKVRAGFIKDVESAGGVFVDTIGGSLMDRMVDEFKRPGRLAGKGFYEYDEKGKRLLLWPGLLEEFYRPEAEIPFEDMKERMLVAAALEAADCYHQGIVGTVADANIGSIFGIGYPAWTGGSIQYINQYPDGVAGFVARARELAGRYGERFTPPQFLVELAASGAELA